MKMIIDIPKGEYDKICKTMLHTSSGNPNFYFESKIANGTPIPDNTTNGDVFSVIYKDISRTGTVLMDDMENIIATNVNIGWWNAPYKVESER